MKYDPRLILVSRSKIRGELLTLARYRFIQATPPFDDARDAVPPGPVTYADMPMRGVPPEDEMAARCRTLAQLKSRSLALAGHPRITQGPHTILLGAQTAVSIEGRPQLPRTFNADECRRFLLTLACGWSVRVVTSVCFLQPDSGSNDCFDDTTTGVFGPIEPTAIDAYLETDAWVGLPGGLALRTLITFWPATFSEDPTTAFGLPMQKVEHGLKRWSISPL